MLDNAVRHSEPGLAVPDGLRLVFQPGYTQEVQPAETLWTLIDEPVVNPDIPTLEALDEMISMRCAALASQPEKIKSQAGFHWWPKIANPRLSPGNRNTPTMLTRAAVVARHKVN